jgi:hypothetical protein
MFNNNQRKGLKAWVRFDGNGNAVAGSLIFQKDKPKVGNWKEYVDVNLCCNPTTTTTTTELQTTTSTTSTTTELTTTTTTTQVPTTTTTTTTEALATIRIQGGPGTEILSMSINGVPINVVSGSFPVGNSFNTPVIGTTNQIGNTTVEYVTTNGSYGINTFYCSGYNGNYYSGQNNVIQNNINISPSCPADSFPAYNVYVTIFLD